MRNFLFLGSCFLLLSGFIITSISKGSLDLSTLFSYDKQEFPEKALYRWNDVNPVTDKGATLGRVLFYDQQLSVNNTTACASCHQQENAFGDSRKVSIGFNGESTARHAMRLINVDFHADNKKFWDERSSRLENTVTLPFKDPIEMGFSGENGFPSIDSLINKMENLAYYNILFEDVFGDPNITEDRMALALAQFIRSMTTFDTKFDEGFNIIGEEITHFPNFTDAENRGKRLFFNPPAGIFGSRDVTVPTGAACGFCHKAPGFDILHISTNNGVIGVANDSTAIDVSVQRSPSLKNLVKPDGSSNGPFMHDGSLETLEDVIEHYNFIPSDPRNDLSSSLLFPMPNKNVELFLTDQEKSDLISFLKTLSGDDIYTNEKWSNPFDDNGNLEILNCNSCETVNNVDTLQTDIIPIDSTMSDTIVVDTLMVDVIQIQEPIFETFSWISQVIDSSACAGTFVDVFDQGAFSYIIIRTTDDTTMYFEDGQFYCQDSPNFSCQSAYKLDDPTYTWICDSQKQSFIDNGLSTLSNLGQQENNQEEEHVNIFPNPSSGIFAISIPSYFRYGQVVISAMSGQVVHQQTFDNASSLKVELNGQAPGLYIVSIISEERKYTQKIIIE